MKVISLYFIHVYTYLFPNLNLQCLLPYSVQYSRLEKPGILVSMIPGNHRKILELVGNMRGEKEEKTKERKGTGEKKERKKKRGEERAKKKD